MKVPLIEVCVEGVDSLMAAQEAGADRVELCAALAEGGLTPSLGTVRKALRIAKIPVRVMIRPRAGDFLYSDAEFASMLADAEVLAKEGAHGVVAGFLDADGSVDEVRTRAFVEAAAPSTVTFHRAFDMARDTSESLEALVRCGVSCVLTSGGRPTAESGARILRQIHQQAAGRLTVVACGGIRAQNLAAISSATGIGEFHCGPLRQMESGMRFHNPAISMSGGDPSREYRTTICDEAAVRAVVEAARSL